MVKRAIQTAIVLGMLLILTACAGGISKQARSQVTYTGAFSDVLSNPDDFQGQTVIWGGKVIEIQNKDEFTELVVLQLALNSQHWPVDSDKSQGRFLIRSDQFMDPVIYPPGALITVVGRLQGAESRLIGEMHYQYPVIDVVEIKKYDPQWQSRPQLHLGIGIGGRF